MSADRLGVYPGTFDPVTNGHLDIISRATRVVDRLIIAVAANAGKEPLFSVDERLAMLTDEIANLANGDGSPIEVRPFDVLLMDFMASVEAGVIVRGLRAVSDFEYEFQMAGMNARLNPDVETVFLMASDRHQFISSRFVKEIGRLGGEVGHFVSPGVRERLVKRFAEGG
ncbi:MAG: pantetheine-phosphate adenylyltransferase [Rhodospirillales bacterium]|jgi:pantetheine-phosphate adenylyltransferase|nr:pantetheine-phosphate adenylyltransferase [Rhodospirillales bacterium]